METFISNSKLNKINEQFKKDTKRFNTILTIFIISAIFFLLTTIYLAAVENLEEGAIIIFVILIFLVVFGIIGLFQFKNNFKSRHMLNEYALELLELDGKQLSYIDKTLRKTLVKDSIFIDRFDSLNVKQAYSFNIENTEGKFFEVYASRSSGKSSYAVLEGFLITLDKTSEKKYNSFLKYNNYSKKGYSPHKVREHKKLYLFTLKNDNPLSIDNYAEVYEKLLKVNACENAALYISNVKTEILIKIKIKPIKIKQIDEETLKQTISYYKTFYNIIKKNVQFIDDFLNSEI